MPASRAGLLVAVRFSELEQLGHCISVPAIQVDCGHFGSLDGEGETRKLWGFTFTFGYSRSMMAEAALDQRLGTLLRLHEEAFRQMGGVPEEILYDRMKTVWLETNERGEVVWHPVFLDFARYWGSRRDCAGPTGRKRKAKWNPV